MGFKAGKILKLQDGQEPVGAVIGMNEFDHGDWITSPG
jgi:hypothetical protein